MANEKQSGIVVMIHSLISTEIYRGKDYLRNCEGANVKRWLEAGLV